MSEEGKKEKEIKIKVKPHSKLNSYQDNIFSQIDRRLMEQGRLNVMQTLGTNSIQQMISDYQDIISGNSLSELLTNVRNSIPEMTRSFTQEISNYNKMINHSALNMVNQMNSLASSVPLMALSNASIQSSQLANQIPPKLVGEMTRHLRFNKERLQKASASGQAGSMMMASSKLRQQRAAGDDEM